MTVTLIDEDEVTTVDAEPRDESLWSRAGGWERKEAGLCRGAACVPLPRGREAELVRADGAVDLAALARHRGQVVVHDDERTVWLLGAPGVALARARTSLEAPEFTLPDLDGRLHSLVTHRGKKVVLYSWSSW